MVFIDLWDRQGVVEGCGVERRRADFLGSDEVAFGGLMGAEIEVLGSDYLSFVELYEVGLRELVGAAGINSQCVDLRTKISAGLGRHRSDRVACGLRLQNKCSKLHVAAPGFCQIDIDISDTFDGVFTFLRCEEREGLLKPPHAQYQVWKMRQRLTITILSSRLLAQPQNFDFGTFSTFCARRRLTGGSLTV
ncbi:hypothetical protein C8R44DRAFT_728747 [Mycena epipterygia]|nr:hypothetical protein C8R44DRAFT_728747 [Mycena epipterygia]